jgi:hypothetical protein
MDTFFNLPIIGKPLLTPLARSVSINSLLS